MLTTNHKNIASFIHIGVFAKYVFPLGNFIAPLLIWTINKDRSDFINQNGKQVINFQLSVIVYLIVMALICIPFALHMGFSIEQLQELNGTITAYDVSTFTTNIIIFIILGVLAIGLLILELYATITGAIKASNGELYHYPISIPFIK
ncbi:MAG: DUF4870 domain-containing protein [Flavobacteriaceae bacterium]